MDGFFAARPTPRSSPLCDIDQATLQKANSLLDNKATLHTDFRKLIEHPNLDAVAIAHAPTTGTPSKTIGRLRRRQRRFTWKKPLSITVLEGRRMVEAARRKRSRGAGRHAPPQFPRSTPSWPR